MGITGLILLMLFPLTLGSQERYGTVVTDVVLDGAPTEELETIPIAIGDTLTQEAVRASIQALYDSGTYGRIEVDAFPEPGGGTRLVFRVAAPYFYATIEMIPKNLFERSLSSYVNLPYGERFSRNSMDAIVAALKDQLFAEGYFESRIDPTYTLDDDTRLATVGLVVEPGPPASVRSVQFQGGLETLDLTQLRDAFNIKPGSRYRLERVQSGAERIRSEFSELGFLNTQVEWSDPVQNYDPTAMAVDITVRTSPGPFAFVDVRGYDLSDDEKRELVPIYEEGTVDDDLIEEGRANILERLEQQGYFQARVDTQPITRFVDGENEYFQINFVVVRGERYSVEEVRIEGNTFLSDARLYTEIGVSQGGLLRRGVFSPELMAAAAARIEAMYVAEGFFGTRVGHEALIDEERNTIRGILTVEEGRRQEIVSVSHSGNSAISNEDLARMANVYPGQIYTPGLIQLSRRTITAGYHAAGYPDARVRALIQQSPDQEAVSVSYVITEGPAYRVGRVFVSGNSLTKEKVILRNSKALRPESPYNPEDLLEAQRSLYATGLFNRVDVVPLNYDRGGYRDVLVQVEDAGPLLLTYGVGVQDREGVRGTVEISHTNLWGLNRSISFRLRGSRREQRFQTTYREPRLFNWELDGFASLFIERARRPTFDADRIDFSIQTLKQFRSTESFLLTASYQTVNLKDVRVNPRFRNFPDEAGTFQISRIGSSYIHDSRRRGNQADPIDPNRGNYFTGTFQVADDSYGSEVNFTSFYGQASIYRPAKTAVLAASARFGWNQPYGKTKSLPITERYFAGGSTTLRAFDQDDAGPEGGGNALVLLNAEYRYPMPFLLPGLGGALFYDTGTVFPRISDFSVGDFTHTVGLGLRYQTPLGPIRADLGFNLNRQADEEHHGIHFTLGHPF